MSAASNMKSCAVLSKIGRIVKVSHMNCLNWLKTAIVFFKACLHEVDKEDKGGIEEDKGG